MKQVLRFLLAQRWAGRTHVTQIWRVLNEPLNRGRKRQLLRDYLDWHFRYKHRGRRWIVTFENGLRSYVYPYPDHDAGEVHIWTRNVDTHDMRLARAILQPGDFVIDAGCNVGNRTLALADKLSGALLIDAGSAAARRCRENLELNGLDPQHFSVLEAAVGDTVGEAVFTDLGGASTSNKVLAAADAEAGVVRVPVTTIDAEVRRLDRLPAFIKIDVEGQDYAALVGARETLESGAVRLVMFERNPGEPMEPFLGLFDELGWAVFGLDKQGRVTQDNAVLRTRGNLLAAPAGVYTQVRGFGWN